jgi:hypothetical protein
MLVEAIRHFNRIITGWRKNVDLNKVSTQSNMRIDGLKS